jgi:hypothetical protein
MRLIRDRASIVLLSALVLSACGGGGGGDDGGAPPPPPAGNVTVSGRITFDRVLFKTPPQTGLNPGAPVESPARQVVVEALADTCAGAALATTTTNATGDYTFEVPANRNVCIRARAQMLKTGAAPTWNFSVRNNTNSDALYALDGSPFNTGAANSTRNLRARVEWNGSAYTNRAGAPFAILDTVYQAKELIVAANATAELPALDLFWSANNRPSADGLCPDTGDIVTSFYVGSGGTDECATPQPLPAGIYILGDFASGAGDTDEFDRHVVAHEFGHYFEDKFSRSDSIGGSHGGNDRLDLRVAFGEGWGNAFGAMTLADPAYRDSGQGAAAEFGFNLESDDVLASEGWYSEFSVGEILWDVFDSTADGFDSVALGFAPIYTVMTGPQVSTDAFTSIFSFADGLRAANSSAEPSINALLSNEEISTTSDEFGDDETNNGGVLGAEEIYTPVTLPTPNFPFCNRVDAGSSDANKLGNRRFFRLDVGASGAIVTITVTGQAQPGGVQATDPDIYVFRQGSLVAFSNEVGASETLSQQQLGAGTHLIEIYDFDIDGSTDDRCMTASFSGL